MNVLQLTAIEAIDIRAVLREKAEALRVDAADKMHNAKLSRLGNAEYLEGLANRLEDWAHAEQEVQNRSQASSARKGVPGRVVRAKPTESDE